MDIAEKKEFVKAFVTNLLAADITAEIMDLIDDKAELIGKSKWEFAANLKPRSAQWERTIADEGEWVAVEFDSEEELKLAYRLVEIAVIRFGFFVRVVDGKIKEVRDYIGIKEDRDNALDQLLCWPPRCPRC